MEFLKIWLLMSMGAAIGWFIAILMVSDKLQELHELKTKLERNKDEQG